MNWSIEWTDKYGKNHFKLFRNKAYAMTYIILLDKSDCTDISLSYTGGVN